MRGCLLYTSQLTAETVNSQNRIGIDSWTQQEHENWLRTRIESDQAHKDDLEKLLGEIAATSAQTYSEQLMHDEAFNAAVTGYHSSLETEIQRHADQQKFIRDTMFLDTDLANSQDVYKRQTPRTSTSRSAPRSARGLWPVLISTAKTMS